MTLVTVSLKYEIVLPQDVLGKTGIKPGQKLRVIAFDNKVILIPVRPIRDARGSLNGIDTNVQREKEDEDRA